MIWVYKWDEWFLYDDNDIIRAHVYEELRCWHWLIFDLKGNVLSRGKARSAEIAKTNSKRFIVG